MSIDEKDIDRRRALLQKDIRLREKKMRGRWRSLKLEVERRTSVSQFIKQNSVAVVSAAAVIGIVAGAWLGRAKGNASRQAVAAKPMASSPKASLSKKVLGNLFEVGKDALVGYMTSVAAQKLQEYLSRLSAPTRSSDNHS